LAAKPAKGELTGLSRYKNLMKGGLNSMFNFGPEDLPDDPDGDPDDDGSWQ